MTFRILTLGCKVNQYESEALSEQLVEAGFAPAPENRPADLYVVNTCTVTGESDRKSRQFIRRAASENPGAPVLVTGCLSQRQSEEVSRIPGVRFVCGTREKAKVVDFARSLADGSMQPGSPVIDVTPLTSAPFEPMRIRHFDRTRAYIKIEDGCNHYCSYCAIPYARGPVRSKPREDVLAELEGFAGQGCPEIVLTGIETGSYGKDLDGYSLPDLLKEADRLPGMGRIRLGSLDPSVITEEFSKAISGLTHICPHFHLSMQSGSDAVLKAMRRNYTGAEAEAALDRLRRDMPGVLFTTDIITGFPGETDEMFEETLSFVRRQRFLHIHVFPYSARKGTRAASFPNPVPVEVRRQRARRLIEEQKRIKRELIESLLPCDADVLFETYENGQAYGHTANFIEVAVPSPVDRKGTFARVRLTSTDGEHALGTIQAT